MAITNILKGLIGKEDMNVGRSTFSRNTSSGTPQTLNQIGLQSFVPGARTPEQYGMKGLGTEDDYAKAYEMLTAGGHIWIPPGFIIGLGQAPLLYETENSYLVNNGTIKLLAGAYQAGNPSVDPPGVFAFHNVKGATMIGGIIDGNSQLGANGISFSHLDSRSGENDGCTQNFLSNVRIRNCRASTDAEAGSDVPHNGGLGNSGGKAITVQFGSPRNIIQGIFINSSDIGISVEGKVNDGGRTRNLLCQNVTMEDCRVGMHLLGTFQPPGLGSDYYGAQFYGIDMRNCGTGELSFGAINALQASNIRIRGLRITNTSGETIGIRGTMRNCEIEGLIEVARLRHLVDFTRNTDGSHPTILDAPSRHNFFDLTAKVHGLGVDGDQFSSYRIRDAGGSNRFRYNHMILRWMIGDGAGVFTDNLKDDLYGFYNDTLLAENIIQQYDLGGQSW